MNYADIIGPILITGGTGFLGCRIAQDLAAQRPDLDIILADLGCHPRAETLISSKQARFIQSDLTDPKQVGQLIAAQPATVFHLASLVSGGAEADYSAGFAANVMATINLVEAIRGQGHCPRVVFASSIATFGGAKLPETIDDYTWQHPQNSYGVAKVLGEQLLNDASRKGFLDARSVRLAAIIVRDEANTAASGYASGLIREPLAGRDYVCPVAAETRLPLMSIDACVQCLLGLAALPKDALADYRAINGPSINPSAAEIAAAVLQVAQRRGLPCGSIATVENPQVMAIVAAWPKKMLAERATAVGLKADRNIEAIIDQYLFTTTD